MRRALAALALCTLAAGGPAGEHGAGGCAEVRGLVRAARIRESLFWIPNSLRSMLGRADQGELALSTESAEALGEAALDAYSPSILASEIADELRANCDALRFQQTLDWFRSPVGVKTVRGQMELFGTLPGEGFDAYLEKLVAEGLEAERLESARAVGAPTLLAMLTPRMMLAFGRPPMLARMRLVARAKSEPLPTEAEMSRVLTEIAQYVGPDLQALGTLTSLFATRNLSDSELYEYRTFLGSAAGVWYDEQLERAFERALGRAGERLLAAYPPP